MRPQAIGDRREIYSGLRARAPFVVRADGRGFGRMLEAFEKPYDTGFARTMAESSRLLLDTSGLVPRLAYTFSDEVSVLFTDEPFGGRLEKLVSVIPSFLSSAIGIAVGRPVSMDARIVPLCPDEIAGYLLERQDEAWRNHVFSCGFYALVAEGRTHAAAMEMLRGMKEGEIHEVLYRKGTNLAKSPAWQRRGIMIYRKCGTLVENWDLPLFGSTEGLDLIRGIVSGESV